MKFTVNLLDSDSRTLLMALNILNVNPPIKNIEENSNQVTPVLELNDSKLNGLLPCIYYLRNQYKDNYLFNIEDNKVKDFEILTDYYFSSLKSIIDYINDLSNKIDNFLNKKFVDDSLNIIESTYIDLIKTNNFEFIKILYSNEIMNLFTIDFDFEDYPKIKKMVEEVRENDKKGKYVNKLFDIALKKKIINN